MNVTNKTLCEIIWNCSNNNNKERINAVIDHIKSTGTLLSDDHINRLQSYLRKTFLPDYNKKWAKANRTKHIFLTKHADFVQKEFQIPFQNSADESCTRSENERFVSNVSDISKRGRPRVTFEEGSSRTKRRRISDIASSYSKEELSMALKLKNKQCDDDNGDNDRNNYDDIDVDDGDGDGDDDDDLYDDQPAYIAKILAMYMDLKLMKRKYQKLRYHNKQIHGDKMYPSYPKLMAYKASCYTDNVQVSQYGAKVNIISLLQHTTEKIIRSVSKEAVEKLQNSTLKLYGK